ncbi:molybdopterin-dependent oxidoreductase [Chloroflexota bacterium]
MAGKNPQPSKESTELQTVTITLDGREVSGYPGMTILELAGESGVDIPTLCHDPHLASIGACRVCLVEDEQSGKLHASCVTQIAPGMVINTSSPKVIEHRRTIVKLMLASHPDSCLVCDKSNRCQLRQIAADLGVGLVDFERIPKAATIEEVNPFIERDLSKCILCAKCIRSCDELVVQGAVDYFRRGFTTRPATLYDLPLEESECTFCGTCVAMCPTGALMEKDREYAGTSRTAIETTCPYCGCGCSIYLEVKNNRFLRTRPGEDNISKGTLCVKGSYGLSFVHSPDRLTSPLARANDDFEEISWEQALEHVATEFKRIRDEHGSDSLAVLGSSKCTNEENYLLQRFARCVLRTNNIDNGSRLYSSVGQNFGYSADPLCALEQSEVIIVIGADPTSSAPVIGYAVKRAVKYKGAKLILIDPRQTGLASLAHLWLRPGAGTDSALLNGMAKVIIDENLLDRDFVIRNTDNYAALTKALKKYTPDYAEALTGISSEAIRSAAQLYTTAARATIIYGTGVTQHKGGNNTVKSLLNLTILTGNIRRAGSILALQPENNGQGACDMGALPDFLPGYASIIDNQARDRFEKRWKAELPANPGLTAIEVIEQAKKGKIKGMLIMGENSVLSFPNGTAVAEVLASLEFLVVQDMFLSATAGLASVVLPAASFAEKDGTFTSLGGKINRIRKAIEPVGESLPDWEIILKLAARMGKPLPFSSLEQVTDEIKEMVPFYKDYGDSNKKLSENGVSSFFPVEYTPPEAEKDDYPFILLTGAALHHSGSGTRSSRSWRLKKYCPLAYLEIGETDAKKLKIRDGDTVSIVSPVDSLSVQVKITGVIPEGVVYIPSSFPETPVNRLFDGALDPETGAPSLKSCRVKIERV